MAKSDEATDPSNEGTKTAGAVKDRSPKVNWDDSKMSTSYANVVNASSTREEVTLFFGTNQTWNISEDREFKVQLSNRIVVNPYAAKRLWTLLGAILKEYENRYGHLELRDPLKKGSDSH